MARKALIRSPIFPYHIFNRSNNKEFFYLSLEELWKIFLINLEELKNEFGCQIHAFVLMSNHYHLVISTPRENIGEASKYFHREVARTANKKTNRINHFFGGRYKWCLIENSNYYWNLIKYVYRNPVKASICQNVESYAFSTLTQNQCVEWNPPKMFSLKIDHQEYLSWLNRPFGPLEDETIRRALRRRQFKPTQQRSGRAPQLDNLDALLKEKGTVT